MMTYIKNRKKINLNIDNNKLLLEKFFGNLPIDTYYEIEDKVKWCHNEAYIDIVTGDLIIDDLWSGYRTEFFDDAFFPSHYDDEERLIYLYTFQRERGILNEKDNLMVWVNKENADLEKLYQLEVNGKEYPVFFKDSLKAMML